MFLMMFMLFMMIFFFFFFLFFFFLFFLTFFIFIINLFFFFIIINLILIIIIIIFIFLVILNITIITGMPFNIVFIRAITPITPMVMVVAVPVVAHHLDLSLPHLDIPLHPLPDDAPPLALALPGELAQHLPHREHHGAHYDEEEPRDVLRVPIHVLGDLNPQPPLLVALRVELLRDAPRPPPRDLVRPREEAHVRALQHHLQQHAHTVLHLRGAQRAGRRPCGRAGAAGSSSGSSSGGGGSGGSPAGVVSSGGGGGGGGRGGGGNEETGLELVDDADVLLEVGGVYEFNDALAELEEVDGEGVEYVEEGVAGEKVKVGREAVVLGDGDVVVFDGEVVVNRYEEGVCIPRML